MHSSKKVQRSPKPLGGKDLGDTRRSEAVASAMRLGRLTIRGSMKPAEKLQRPLSVGHEPRANPSSGFKLRVS